MNDSKEDIKQRFGLAVRKRRLELGISQEDLAHRCQLHRTYIGDIERGERNVSLQNIEKILEALEIRISVFFERYEVD
jgi:transcriptional regulator with XRE-family HTH domain